MSNARFYCCEDCGDVFALLKGDRGDYTCSGTSMKIIDVKTADEGKEKHVPKVTKENGKIKVEVGAILHPMLQEHYIEWIALETNGKLQFVFLKPGDEPMAEFEDAESGTVYELCSIHGLWKSEF